MCVLYPYNLLLILNFLVYHLITCPSLRGALAPKNQTGDVNLDNRNKYYENNTEMIKDNKKKYYENNKDRIRDRQRRYYWENRKAVLDSKQKKYYLEHIKDNLDNESDPEVTKTVS